jgi:hypothetical protein
MIMNEDHFDPWNEPERRRSVPGWVVAAVNIGLWVAIIALLRGKLL